MRVVGDSALRAAHLESRLGMKLLSAEEHTAYAGRHFMDCIVRLNGQVYAVRRVPVTIRDVQHVARNPPRPAYTKLTSLLRRRRKAFEVAV